MIAQHARAGQEQGEGIWAVLFFFFDQCNPPAPPLKTEGETADLEKAISVPAAALYDSTTG